MSVKENLKYLVIKRHKFLPQLIYSKRLITAHFVRQLRSQMMKSTKQLKFQFHMETQETPN